MENALKKYISPDVQKELIEQVIDKLSLLKRETDNFNSLLKDKQIFLNNKSVKLFYDFLYAYGEIYNKVDKKEFLNEIEGTSLDNEVEFWNSIVEYFDHVEVVENETTFLRKMDISEFKEIILYTFNSNILFDGTIKDYEKWDKEKIKAVQKTINTFLYHMIDEFNDFDTAVYILDLKFKFEREKYQYIWDLCEKDKMYLMLKNITRTLDELYCAKETN